MRATVIKFDEWISNFKGYAGNDVIHKRTKLRNEEVILKKNTICQMTSTEVQTVGELRMRDTTNWWAGLLLCIYSWSES